MCHSEPIIDPTTCVLCGEIERESIDDMLPSLRHYYDLEIQQLQPGAYRGRMQFIASAGALLYRERYPQATNFAGELKGGRFGIGLPLDGPAARFAGTPTSPQLAASAMTGEQIDFITPAGHAQLLMLVDHARLYELAECSRVAPRVLRALAPQRSSMPLNINPRAAACITQTFSRLLDRATHGGYEASRENFENLILDAILSMVEHIDEPSGHPPALTLFRRARDHGEQLGGQPTVSALAAALRVSPRTLHHAFVSATGLPPSDYFLHLRLNRARAALLKASPASGQVTRIATGLGFTELGRFAGRYRRLFGETPLETLRRCAPHPVAIPAP